MIAMLSAFGNVPAAEAFCFGTGNTARQRDLDVGLIEEEYSADFVLLDQAQHAPGKSMLHSVELGNLPCLLYTSPSPRDVSTSRMPSSA